MGASSGIGRALALAASGAGAAVALAARRTPLVESAVAEARAAGAAQVHALVCDVADPSAALGAAATAAEALGGLDTLVYAAGTSVLAPVSELTAEQWRDVLDTNLVGAALVVAGALGPLRAAAERAVVVPTVAFLSSHVVPRPPPGLVAYAASKAGLDALARGLRAEEPWLRVVNVVVGNTTTGFADRWDKDAAGRAIERWFAEGYLDDRIFSAEQMAALVLGAIGDDSGPLDVSALDDPVLLSDAARRPAR